MVDIFHYTCKKNIYIYIYMNQQLWNIGKKKGLMTKKDKKI